MVWDNRIAKRELHVHEAWEIDRHGLDSVGILADDDPIIPQGREDAPVFDLLRWKRERESENPDETSNSEAQRPVRLRKKQGRNEPCSCGSGKKYKRCCGR